MAETESTIEPLPMPSRLLVASMPLIVAIAYVMSLEAAPRPQSTATPDSMSLEEWSKLILKNPDDQVLWNRELARLKQFRPKLEGYANPATDIDLAMALANNDELQGLAFRHLKRYPESLEALGRSDKQLLTLWMQQACDSGRPGRRCSDIAEARVRGRSFTATVYTNARDTTRADSTLRDVVAMSRTTKRYRDHFRQTIGELLQRDGFATAGVLVVTELQHAVDTHRDDQLKVAAETAEAMLRLFFNGISWTGKNTLRDADPRDFVDNTGIGIGRRTKYGMTDPLEDEATFATAMFFEKMVGQNDRSSDVLDHFVKSGGYASVDELLQNARLTEYIRREMIDGNLEPVAKHAYFELSGTLNNVSGQMLICRDRVSEIPFAEIRRRLREAPAGTVAATTSDILIAFDRLARFRDANCRSKTR